MKNIDDLLKEIIKNPVVILSTYMLDILFFRPGAHHPFVKIQGDRRETIKIPTIVDSLVDIKLKDCITGETQDFENINFQFHDSETHLNLSLMWEDNEKVKLEIVNFDKNTHRCIEIKKSKGHRLLRGERGDIKFIWRDFLTDKIIASERKYIGEGLEIYNIKFPYVVDENN
jgi:hypothetical protein